MSRFLVVEFHEQHETWKEPVLLKALENDRDVKSVSLREGLNFCSRCPTAAAQRERISSENIAQEG